MSQATKRKHVVKEVLGEHMVPADHQQIVKVLRTPGNNLHEVETAQGQRFLVSMPSKFRKNIWIKRGDFLIVDPIEEGEKVKAEISFVLCKDHVRSLKKDGRWPEAFSEVDEKHNNINRQSQPELPAEPKSSGEESSSEDDSDLFVNTNRRQYHESEEESEEEEAV
uniref:Probable RNA-binding protein EIF1AD n=1 Tax=Jaculus jaculus TaxID=51337 RepID=A0A8C5L6G1_JACJA|nr:probable RNA-binding protein EIF1AD [Jaculus jaculus]XP_044996600.1 probable RNA-binding protein EIF1AD [Jaculus jaculus]XP_044996606.1 probable RNA-binding protein EIF1AD [Jaculus jaculus]